MTAFVRTHRRTAVEAWQSRTGSAEKPSATSSKLSTRLSSGSSDIAERGIFSLPSLLHRQAGLVEIP